MSKILFLDDYRRVPQMDCFERGPGYFLSFSKARLACSSDISCVGISGYSSYYTCLQAMRETSSMLDDASISYKKIDRFSKHSIMIYTIA